MFLSLDRLAPFFCGESKMDLFDINFSPGLVIGTPDDIKNDLNGGITDGDPDLPSECSMIIYLSRQHSFHKAVNHVQI